MIPGEENYQILHGYVTMVTEPCCPFTELYRQSNNFRCLKEMPMDSRRESAASMAVLALENRTGTPKKTRARNTVLWNKFVTSAPSTHRQQVKIPARWHLVHYTTPVLDMPELANTLMAPHKRRQDGHNLETSYNPPPFKAVPLSNSF